MIDIILHNLLPIISSILATSGFGYLINYFSSRKEARAKVRQMNVADELTLAGGWQIYADEQRKTREKDLLELRDEIKRQADTHDLQIARLKTDHDAQIKELEDTWRIKEAENRQASHDRQNKIQALQLQVEEQQIQITDLKKKLERYENVSTIITNTI